MATAATPRIFDPRDPRLRDHWIVLLNLRYFVVPAQRGGWKYGREIVAPGPLVELPGVTAQVVWEILRSVKRPG
jgi:hypothetical protein